MKARPGDSPGKDGFGKEGKEALGKPGLPLPCCWFLRNQAAFGVDFPSTERLWLVCLIGAGCPGPALVAVKQRPHPCPGTGVHVIPQALTSQCQAEAGTRAVTAKPAPHRWRGVGYSGARQRNRALPSSSDHSWGSPRSEASFGERTSLHPSHVIRWVF